MITLKETVELTCNNSINSFSDILGKKIRENYRTMDAAVSRLELFYLMTVMPDIIVERKNYYRQLFYLKTQMPSIKLTILAAVAKYPRQCGCSARCPGE